MSLSISDGIRKGGTKQSKLGRVSSHANDDGKGATSENQPPQLKSLKIATGQKPGRQRLGQGSTVKTFTCHFESCGKEFSDRASLKKHMTVHGDKLVSATFDPFLTSLK